jgi:UDP-glucose 4-epimerase
MRQRNWQCDITPLRQDLGYEPEWPLERGVKECIQWYKDNKWL